VPDVPENWVPCAGQLLPIQQNQALFAILGTSYGGDGVTHFALPNLPGRVPVGSGRSPISSSVAPMARTPAGNVWSTALAPAGGQPPASPQPCLVGSYCIALCGIFPTRN
jgi:microcystin-dependent protein